MQPRVPHQSNLWGPTLQGRLRPDWPGQQTNFKERGGASEDRPRPKLRVCRGVVCVVSTQMLTTHLCVALVPLVLVGAFMYDAGRKGPTQILVEGM